MNNMPFRKYNKQTALTNGQRCLFVICDLSIQMQAALQTRNSNLQILKSSNSKILKTLNSQTLQFLIIHYQLFILLNPKHGTRNYQNYLSFLLMCFFSCQR